MDLCEEAAVNCGSHVCISLPTLALVPSKALSVRSQDVPIPDPSSAAKDVASSLAWASPGIFSSASLPSKRLSQPPLWLSTEDSCVPLVFAAFRLAKASFSGVDVAFDSSVARVGSEEVGEGVVVSITLSEASAGCGLLSDCVSAVLES